ncbi:hypothetical protein PspLS_01553 [Pyricularia sp. CBS 133598]|nr:hypothetical protein PspLS_01553 [Pyricularia sp. CBS 133598]
MIPAHTTSNAYYDPEPQYKDESTAWSSQQLQLYQPPPPPQHIQYRRYPTHRRKHPRRQRPARPDPLTLAHSTSEAQLGAYAAHHLIPALQSSPHPVSVLINYGHAVIPESALVGDDSSSSSSIVYNAPGCTLTVVPAASVGPASQTAEPTVQKDGRNNALLRACRTCGVLRVVDAWGTCRDCGDGRRLDSGRGWEREDGGWRRQEMGYLARSGQRLGAGQY